MLVNIKNPLADGVYMLCHKPVYCQCYPAAGEWGLCQCCGQTVEADQSCILSAGIMRNDFVTKLAE